MALSTTARQGLGLVLLILLVGTGWEAWRAWQQQRAVAALASLARPGDLRMISSQSCVYCAQARQMLRAGRVPFDECFIERDAACAADFQALGAPGTPLLRVRGQVQLGFSPARVAQALAQPPGQPASAP
jgi:glutaredoxin